VARGEGLLVGRGFISGGRERAYWWEEGLLVGRERAYWCMQTQCYSSLLVDLIS
jgi:hypothetical protein